MDPRRKQDLAKTKMMILRLGRIAASMRNRLARLERNSQILKRGQWELESAISECNGLQNLQPRLGMLADVQAFMQAANQLV